MITVNQLIVKLQQLDPNLVVILQKDGEGNEYSPLCDADLAYYTAINDWSGDASDTDSLDAVECVVLYPVN